MYLLLEIKHAVLIQCYGNHIEVKKFNYTLEIDLKRNSSQTFLGVLMVGIFGLGVQMMPKRPDG